MDGRVTVGMYSSKVTKYLARIVVLKYHYSNKDF